LWLENSSPKNEANENLACYILRASFSQERLTYLLEEGQISFRPKGNRKERSLRSQLAVWQIAHFKRQLVNFKNSYLNLL
jgi:hypothetical protein